eukprot:gene23311-biopygen23822
MVRTKWAKNMGASNQIGLDQFGGGHKLVWTIFFGPDQFGLPTLFAPCAHLFAPEGSTGQQNIHRAALKAPHSLGKGIWEHRGCTDCAEKNASWCQLCSLRDVQPTCCQSRPAQQSPWVCSCFPVMATDTNNN